MRMCSPMSEHRVFSGIQPSGNLHLGNYLGAIVNFVSLQKDFECIYCIVDMHAITVWQHPADLRRKIREVAAGFIASGVDPSRSIVFNQSRVSNHAELAWILNCVARIGWLNRMTQFKDKAGRHRENASVGLFAYPVLMAADILSYRATHVPVGDDQKQHLELTRDIAQKFNLDFSDSLSDCGFGDSYFPIVEPVIQGLSTRVMSLRDGSKKMSSSDSSDYSRLNMLDDVDAISLKLRKAKTDSEPLPCDCKGLEARLEAANLVAIYASLAGIRTRDVLHDYGGARFSVFKQALIDLVIAKLQPISLEMRRLISDPGYIDTILIAGAERAHAISDPILRDVKEIVGFIDSSVHR